MSSKNITSNISFNPVGAAQKWFNKNKYSLLVLAIILGFWEIYSRYYNEIGDIYFPSIAYSIDQTITNSDVVIEATKITFAEVFVGFLMGVTFGIILGIVYSESYFLRQASLPMLIFTYSLPFAIVAPIFIIWFGTSILAIGAFVSLFSFYPVFINTITGFTHVDEEYYHLAEVMDASRYQFVKEIKFWVAFPHIVGGIKVAVQQSVVGAIVAEFIGSGGGLGNLIVISAITQRTGMMFGIVFLIMIIAVIYFNVVSWLIDYAVPGPATTKTL